jgi:hypothetical protein
MMDLGLKDVTSLCQMESALDGVSIGWETVHVLAVILNDAYR